jgi:hypothetical protein
MTRFEQEWRRYATAAVSPLSSNVHFCQTRRAFYAGAIVLMNAIAMMEDTDDETFDELQKELQQFNERVDAGDA